MLLTTLVAVLPFGVLELKLGTPPTENQEHPHVRVITETQPHKQRLETL